MFTHIHTLIEKREPDSAPGRRPGRRNQRERVYYVWWNNSVQVQRNNTMPGTWSEEDDIKLWSLRSKPESSAVYNIFNNKSAGAIRSRLKHLQDPSHKAYQRRVKNDASSISLDIDNYLHIHKQTDEGALHK